MVVFLLVFFGTEIYAYPPRSLTLIFFYKGQFDPLPSLTTLSFRPTMAWCPFVFSPATSYEVSAQLGSFVVVWGSFQGSKGASGTLKKKNPPGLPIFVFFARGGAGFWPSRGGYPYCSKNDGNVGKPGQSIKRPKKGFGRFSGKFMHSANHTKRPQGARCGNLGEGGGLVEGSGEK